MAISDKLNKLNTDLVNAYNSISTKGGTVPNNKNSENLSSAINSISLNGLKFINSGEFTTSSSFTYIIDTGTEYADLIVVHHEDYGESSDDPTYSLLFLSMYIPMEHIAYPGNVNNDTYHNVYLYGRKNASVTTPLAYGNGASTGGYYLENNHYYFKCSRNASTLPLKTTGKYKWEAYKYTSNN